MILAFCEPSNPFRTWNESKEKFFADFHRRNTRSLDNGNDSQSDSVAKTYFINEIQNSLREMTGNVDLEQLGFSKLPSNFSFVVFDESFEPKEHDEWWSLDSNMKKFNEDQVHVFNSILNEILPAVTVSHTLAPVTKPFSH